MHNTRWCGQKVTDGTQYFPLGWTNGKISGSGVANYTELFTAGTNHVCGTLSGTRMMRYRSSHITTSFGVDEKHFAASPRQDLNTNAGAATISFWTYTEVNQVLENPNHDYYGITETNQLCLCKPELFQYIRIIPLLIRRMALLFIQRQPFRIRCCKTENDWRVFAGYHGKFGLETIH